jgi:hypothetical protein
MTPEGFARCQELYREAIRLDPQFAPPYAQLADSFTSVAWWADLPPSGAIAQALPLAEKALALDSGLAHAYSVRCRTRAFFLRDLPGGERDLRRAVKLAPNSALSQAEIPRLNDRAFGQDRSASKEKRLLTEREGTFFRAEMTKPEGTLGLPFGALHLHRQGLPEGPPPLDALFAFGSMAPRPEDRSQDLVAVILASKARPGSFY